MKNSCTNDDECENDVPDSVCINNRCLCKEGLVANFGKTVSISQ